MQELGYGEATVDVSGGTDWHSFIDLGTLSIGGTGEIICECFVPLGNFKGNLGGGALQFAVLFNGGHHLLANCVGVPFTDEDAAVYGQRTFVIDVSINPDVPISLEIALGSGISNAYCSPPLVPAWFRVIGEPSTEPSVPYVTIAHTFGLGN